MADEASLGGVALWLDHASISVPDLAPAVDHLDRRLGLHATLTPEAPGRHSRVYLHRSYLEVSAGTNPDGWEAKLFFLRFEDRMALRAHLGSVGIRYRFSGYQGVDGTWDDVEIGVEGVPMPILVRRTDPPDVAPDWPPALSEPHRCGARALAAVHVEVPSLEETVEVYRRLLGVDPPAWPSAGSERRYVRVPLASGEVVLHEGGSGAIVGIVLGVTSLAATRAASVVELTPIDEGVAWLDPAETFGVRLGLSEL